jgi:predicted TPR repeat methyltransferase
MSEGSSPREISFAEAVNALSGAARDEFVADFLRQAREAHRRGELSTAELAYRHVLQIDSDNADALDLLGMLAAQTGHLPQALALLDRAVERAPCVADFHINRGNILRLKGQFEEAAAAYRAAIAIDGHAVGAYMNLGAALARLGQLDPAAEAAQRAVALAPDNADVHYVLANIRSDQRQWAEATAAYRRVLALDSAYLDAYEGLVYLLCRAGNTEEAGQLVRSWRRLDPADPRSGHMLAALTGEDVPARASSGYVRTVFDRFAESFDEKLHSLDYRAPQLVTAAVEAALGAGRSDLDVLDAGCGTGLCGPLLRPYARRLMGVDLSPAMLQRAELRGCYDALATADLPAYLEEARQQFDLIAAADVLCYFGDLSPVLTAAGTALRPGGHFAFTVEHLREDEAAGLRLNRHGRYSHSTAHVADVASAAGFSLVRSDNATLRTEAGEPVAGLVVLLRRAGDLETEVRRRQS